MDENATTEATLAGLQGEDLDRFVAACRPIRLKTGERVFSEGDAGDEIFLVRTGRVRISRSIAVDVDRSLAILGPGSLFGEIAMVDSGPRSATATAIDPSEVLALGRDAFRGLVAEKPGLGLKLLGYFASELARRVRLSNDLVRDTVAWGLEVSGAAQLNLHTIVRFNAELDLTLAQGLKVKGRLLKVDRHEFGVDLIIKDANERLQFIPYHAVVSIAFPGEVIDAKFEQENL